MACFKIVRAVCINFPNTCVFFIYITHIHKVIHNVSLNEMRPDDFLRASSHICHIISHKYSSLVILIAYILLHIVHFKTISEAADVNWHLAHKMVSAHEMQYLKWELITSDKIISNRNQFIDVSKRP